eukprot:TRINITY_DN4737_c0_g1_i4.p1 TRINITY_DN4737_c0_g1~~TRINITY_DN4737_c0_g1_i4.p1  ORF type:complete len:542 (+),score=110.18 TRINITY_DN4737_c0_g1_i4:72-1697(+)
MKVLALATLAAAAAGQPGSGLRTFGYGPQGRPHADTKYWRIQNWGTTMTDMIDVLHPDPSSSWSLKYDSRSTVAHETCHAIGRDLTKYGSPAPCPGFTNVGFYLGNKVAICVGQPKKFDKDDVRDWMIANVPSLRWQRFKLYLTEINLGGDPLLLFNEWNCYIVGSKTSLGLYEEKLLVDQEGSLVDPASLIKDASKETNSADVGLGAPEFMIYALSVLIVAEQRDPDWFNGSEGKQAQEFAAVNIRRTFTVFCPLFDLATKADPPIYQDQTMTDRYALLRDSAEGKIIRDFAERLFGKEWFNKLLNCEDVAPVPFPTATPPTPAPDYGPDCVDQLDTSHCITFRDMQDACERDSPLFGYTKDNCRRTCMVEEYCTVQAPPPTPEPAVTTPETPVPATPAPPTPVPGTEAPETSAPETQAPETLVPETDVPATPVPETNAPDTIVPETDVPATPVPQTNAPNTLVPDTNAPETPAPETTTPETPVPETDVPATAVPETNAPDTIVPETTDTDVPATPAGSTQAPETDIPATPVPRPGHTRA